MLREQLLKLIAVAGYDVGFGAKTHFATFDIIEKAPGWLGFLSLAGGVYSLFIPFWGSQHVAAIFVIFGVISIYVGMYGAEKSKYEEVGKKLTHHFHALHTLYRKVEALPSGADASLLVPEFEKIRFEANAIGVSKQIFLSDWYAHYKFFWQNQIDWINESRPFNFFRDKIPLSVYITLLIIIVAFGWCLSNPACSICPTSAAVPASTSSCAPISNSTSASIPASTASGTEK